MKFKRRILDNVEVETMNTRDIAIMSFEHVMNHEQVCASRWGVIIKLMWAVLSGIGFLILEQLNNGLTHIFHTINWG